jgi:precorrin-6Y C5,15-methyltransferase (decarboxylating)
MKRSLALIGMGEDGFDGLSAAARTLISQAEIIVGSGRLLSLLPPLNAVLHNWPSPFDPMIDRIKSWSDKRVVILATGDPMNYGVGALLAPRLREELKIIPAPSAFSLAAARLGWSLPEIETISLHGRDVALLDPLIAPGVKILALTEGEETVRAAAERLLARNYDDSHITLLEHMGGPLERRTAFKAHQNPPESVARVSTIAIECVAGPGSLVLPRVPALPDDAFVHDGQITKRDVRAITLSSLGPLPGALLWDVGAGCGSISVEWMRAARNARAIAYEPNAERCRMISANANALGTPDLRIVAAPAPDAFRGEPPPDAVFLGGAVSNARLFDQAWSALRSGGRLVANAVTLEGEAAIIDYQREHGGELIRIDVSCLIPLGAKRGMRPQMSVMQWRTVKP